MKSATLSNRMPLIYVLLITPLLIMISRLANSYIVDCIKYGKL